MGGGPVPRPPPTRLPSNLPALQGMAAKAGSSAADATKMGGVGRGSLLGGGPDASGAKNSFAAAQLAAGGMSMPGAGVVGLGAAAAAAAMPGGGAGWGGVVASINVYVGKLKAEVDNSLVQELLWCCGRVDKWNRAVDPSTDLPKAFGFCTYRSAQAAAVCVQVRNRGNNVYSGCARIGMGGGGDAVCAVESPGPGVFLLEGLGRCEQRIRSIGFT